MAEISAGSLFFVASGELMYPRQQFETFGYDTKQGTVRGIQHSYVSDFYH